MIQLHFLNKAITKSMLKEVFACFIQGNNGPEERLSLTDEVLSAVLDCWGCDDLYQNMRLIETSHKNNLNKLNFKYKARALLPLIFDVPPQECKKQIESFMLQARKSLINKKNALRHKQNQVEISDNEIKNYLQYNRKEIPTFLSNLAKRIENFNPQNDEEYQKAMLIIENTPEWAFDQGHLPENYHDSVALVNRWEERYKIQQLGLDLNKQYWQEMQEYEDEKIYVQDHLIISPSIFQENKIGYDIQQLTFRKEFAANFAQQILKREENQIFIENLEKWEYELLRAAGLHVRSRHKDEDEYGNIQLKIKEQEDDENE